VYSFLAAFRENAKLLSLAPPHMHNSSSFVKSRNGSNAFASVIHFYLLFCRHTLEILKTIKLDNFPLSKFIIKASSQVGPPEYLYATPHELQIDGNYFSPLMGPWPNANQLNLDPTQFEAFQAAVTNEFAIIQGPPGTGKTYLGKYYTITRSFGVIS